MDPKDQALLALGRNLQASDYRFTTITPASHTRVNSRSATTVASLQRIFGWSRPFTASELPPHLVALLEQAGQLESQGNLLRSRVRFSTLGDQLFVHSAFPTEASETVFFGPDTYRFARALRFAIADMPALDSMTLIDIGCGSGAGGLHAASLLGHGKHLNVVLADINPTALRFSEVNAQLNGVPNVTVVLSDLYKDIDRDGHLIISNPPYLVDSSQRLYRHGGGEFGFELSLRIVERGIDRLHRDGRLFLYTGTPVIDGVDKFFEAVRPCLEVKRCAYSYEEIDPDVFGEELENPPYDRVDRIAAVALSIRA